MMKTGSEKYDRIMETLRKSIPEMNSYQEIENNVMERISVQRGPDFSGIIDFLFGWIYIGWVRRTLIAASFTLLGFFIWQQNNIINQIDHLSRQIKNGDRLITYNPTAALEKKQVFLKMSQEREGNLVVSEEDLIRLIDSLNNLNIRYRDLRELIDDDPELKRMVEEKLEKNLQSKFKL